MTPEEREDWEKRNEMMGPRWHNFWFHVYWLSARLFAWLARILEASFGIVPRRIEEAADRRIDFAELHMEKLQQLEEA